MKASDIEGKYIPIHNVPVNLSSVSVNGTGIGSMRRAGRIKSWGQETSALLRSLSPANTDSIDRQPTPECRSLPICGTSLCTHRTILLFCYYYSCLPDLGAPCPHPERAPSVANGSRLSFPPAPPPVPRPGARIICEFMQACASCQSPVRVRRTPYPP